MAGHNGISQGTETRGPKYRTSCDRCQAAKVKCGHEKPSCRRCTYHKVECVYGISRRMGRPRAKKNSAKDKSLSPQNDSNNDASDENNSSRRSTMAMPIASAGGFAEPESTIEVRPSPAQNPESGRMSRAGSVQRTEPWAPSLATNFERPELNDIVSESNHDAILGGIDTPLAFLPPDGRMDLDDCNDFPPMSSFLDDLSNSLMSPASSLDMMDPQALMSAGTPVTRAQDAFGPVDAGQTLVSPRQVTQSWNSSNPMNHQVEPSFRPNLVPKIKRRASTGQQFSGISVEFPGRGESMLFDGKMAAQSRYGTIPLVSVVAGGQSADPDSRSATTSHELLMDEDEASCNCHLVITDCIVSLKAEQQKANLMPMDCALRIESEVEASLSTVHECKNCRCESSMHLLSLVGVRLMLDILQKTVRDEFVTRPRRADNGAIAINNNDMLVIGRFKVPPRTRCRFLRKVVQARFLRLAMLVEQRGKLVNGGLARDCYSKSGALLLGDISRGLRTIMGWVELWNSKH